jgi:conjugal transfer pilus assembly protein TrbC
MQFMIMINQVISKAVVIFLTGLAFSTSCVAWNENAPRSSVLVFASFSMPEESLRGFLKEAEKIKAPVIIRGLIHNSFSDTTQALLSLMPDKRGGLQVDPTLFQRFHIKTVPAVVVLDESCLADAHCQTFDVVYGNVTLSYALEEMAKQQDAISTHAQAALKKLKGAE